ncbi:MAG: tyrosine-type recombinase/integrase [Barnesiella sp.]|nr:tyrosine-type recombinase/integrase [Barnesiella sp.]
MITINYQMFGNKGFQLRLRLYQDGETKFINVTKMLKGSIQKRHWNQRKQLFIPSCPFSDENNAILVQFRQKYDEFAINWTGSVFGMVEAMKESAQGCTEQMTLTKFIHLIVERLGDNKHADGTIKGTFEGYLKCDRRLHEFCKARKINYSKILIKEVSPTFINDVFDWIDKTRGGKGKGYISSMLHSIIAKAEDDNYLKAEDFKKCNWHKKIKGSKQKCHTLTEEQCQKFASMDLSEVSSSKMNELYRDFCLFILYTGQSACDAISLRYSDVQNIGGISHFVFRRRKIAEKQSVPCSVPINQELDTIMRKWSKLSKDGYIFPIRNKTKIKNQTTNNGDIKHFIGKLNIWLKKVGKALGCPFPLHSYTFRHTAITHYISKGVPVIYVANMMGTSVDNCEKIYYNNQGDTSSRNKVMAAMKF